MKDSGLTLVEALVAIVILGIAAVGILPAFVTQMNTNTRNEVRGGAVTAAQQVVESLRMLDPASLPTSGDSDPQLITIGDRQFQVVTRYCVRPEYCAVVSSRHLIVEVSLDGQQVYDVETVFTRLE